MPENKKEPKWWYAKKWKAKIVIKCKKRRIESQRCESQRHGKEKKSKWRIDNKKEDQP